MLKRCLVRCWQEETKNLCYNVKSVFASIPHTLFLTQEAYYHSLVYLLLKLLGFTIHAEPLTNLSWIDAGLQLPEVVYILEFKMSTAQLALD